MSVKGRTYRISFLLVLLLTGLSAFVFAQTPELSSAVPSASTDSLVVAQRDEILKTYTELKEKNKFTDYLDLSKPVDFPIGILKTIGNLEYVIAIDSIVMTPAYAFLNASMLFIEPRTGKKLAFRGTDIRFTSAGGLTGDARLELVGDYELDLPGGNASLVLLDKQTYVEWDCDGFKQFGITAALNFSRDVLLPVDEQGNVIEGEAGADFSVIIRDWNDLVAKVNIRPFQVTRLKGFSFYVEDAIFDYSDFRNPEAITYPKDYLATYFLEGNEALWRGVFIRSVVVSLPSQFVREDGTRPQIRGDNMLIDRMGFSGELAGNNILSFNKGGSGSMQGWPFSVDRIRLRLIAGNLTEGGLEGEIILPVTDEQSTLNYKAIVDRENNYYFNIRPADSLEFALWKAGEVSLYPTSYVNVEVVNGKFTPSASLTGMMSISAPIGNNATKLANIKFEEVLLTAKAPYVSGGVFSKGGGSDLPQLSGFNLDVEKIGIRTLKDSTLSLDIKAGVILSGAGGGSFAAKGGFSILSKTDSVSQRASLVYEKIKVNEIELRADNGAFKIAGQLKFYDTDPVYGNGFSGSVKADFKPGIKLEASARFGKVNTLKYWYVDANTTFKNPIIIGTGFGIYGFGGGAYYHMQQKPGTANTAKGRSLINYVPSKESGLGLRAAVAFGSAPAEGAYAGDASFEILFYKAGGIRNINFKGEVKFMDPPIPDRLAGLQQNMEIMAQHSSNKKQPEDAFQKKEEDKQGKNSNISGHVSINYDFDNRILHGNIDVYVNVAGGILRGTGNRNRAGWAVLHFAPEEWYVHIGTPSDRLGLQMGVGSIAARANGYFMVGTNMPASPPPDENVGRILGGIDLDYMRDENALGMGAGFALGAALSFNTGNLTFWKFYARFMAGVGFDIMLKNYGEDVRCANRSGTIGVNGWYANGQAYAFFDGKIGIHIDVLGMDRDIDIINLAAAAVLQAKMPNPLWMRGIVGGWFSILGGLVKGQCRFQVTIGEECEIVGGSAVSSIKVIADVTPAEGSDDINVFNNPQVVFNMPIGEIFELTDIDNVRRAFRIKLDHFRLRAQGGIIPGEIEWNVTNDVAVFVSDEILPPRAAIKVEVQVSFEKREGGKWLPVTSKGNIIIEKQESKFTTGTAPDFIPLSNIAYSYPLVEMVNFYPEEYPQGYIQLIKGQKYLFEDPEFKQTGRMKSAVAELEFDYTYDVSAKRVGFNLPVLDRNRIYTLELVNVPTTSGGAIDRNVTTTVTALESGAGSDIAVKGKTAEGTIEELRENIVFTTRFRSSTYTSFTEKMQAMQLGRTFRVMTKAWDQHLLQTELQLNEYFADDELTGNRFSANQPLVSMTASLQDNDYYQNKIFPLVYANYPLENIGVITERDTATLGLPPVRALEIMALNQWSTKDFISAVAAVSAGNRYLIYDLPRIYRKDYFEIRGKVVPQYVNQPAPIPDQVYALMFSNFPIVHKGHYKIRFNYTLPGTQKPHASVLLTTELQPSQ